MKLAVASDLQSAVLCAYYMHTSFVFRVDALIITRVWFTLIAVVAA